MKIAIIGGGQQGSSIATALETRNADYQVSVFDSNPAIRDEFQSHILNDHPQNIITLEDTLGAAVRDADIVILATPIDRFSEILNSDELRSHLKSGAVITDIGSAKAKSIMEIKNSLPENAIYVPAHPVVGSAGVGPVTSKPTMYENELIALIPENTEGYAVAAEQVSTMWEATGARTMNMSALQHDKLYGLISHFEHVVAFSLTETHEDLLHGRDYRDFGSTTLDITRVANASAPMWNAIFQHNQSQILASAEGFRGHLNTLKSALATNSPAELETLLRPAHQFRTQINDTRVREGLISEVIDFIDHENIEGADALKPATLSRAFNQASSSDLAQRISLPAVISAAITLNAMDVEKDLGGLRIKDMVNPSFRDGSSVMLSDPNYVANVLYYNRDALTEKIAEFESKFDIWVDQIRNFDSNVISSHIDEVAGLRRDMPAHRTTDLRQEYDVRPQSQSQLLENHRT